MKVLILITSLALSAQCFSNESVPAKSELPSNQVSKETTNNKLFTEIIEDLKEGNRRYMAGQGKHPNQDASTRQSLMKGQNPKSIILSCSDSRVPAEIIFDKGVGDLFVIRNAGNIAENISIASIEYAVEHLGSKILVVMGHQSCGAVTATLKAKKGKSAGSPNLDLLVKNIEGNLSYTKGVSKDLTDITPAVTANVRGVVASLMKRSKIIREAVERNHLMIVQALYHFDSGEAEILEIGRPLLIGFEEKQEKKIKHEEEKSSEGEVPEYMKRHKKDENEETKPTEEKS